MGSIYQEALVRKFAKVLTFLVVGPVLIMGGLGNIPTL